jgi:hypothetical protein
MAKLVTIESGKIVPLDGDDVAEDKIITEKTWLIIDGNNISLTDKYGNDKIQTFKNFKLILDDNSKYKEISIFFNNLWHTLCHYLYIFTWRSITIIERLFQTAFRKSHLSDYDLFFFSIYLSKRILKLIKDYRKRYMERKEEMSDEKEEWLAVLDKIIFGLRWIIEVNMFKTSKKHIKFFKDYYGQYLGKKSLEKYFKQFDDSVSRMHDGFMLFGRFFVRESDKPDHDLNKLNISLAKIVLPKITAYRKRFLEQNKKLEVFNNLSLSSMIDELSIEEKEEIATMTDEEKIWIVATSGDDGPKKEYLINQNEIIYAMRWCLEVDNLNDTSKKIKFFKEYFGEDITFYDKEKSLMIYDKSLLRAKRGFMSFGWFLSNCEGLGRNIELDSE